MVRIAAGARAWLCLSLAAFVLIAAFAGSGAHALSDEHRAAAAVHHHDSGSSGAADAQDGGHDHFQGLSLAAAALFGGPSLPAPPVPASIQGATPMKLLRPLPADPPPAEPPRPL